MNLLANLRSQLMRQLNEDERGTTLTELIVGMGLLAMFMGMFTGAMLLMSNTVNKVQAITTTSNQVNTAFLELDKSVRYATGISPYAKSSTSNDWHVEYDVVTPTGGSQCVQLRVDGTKFQRRTWIPSSDGSTYSGLTAWSVLASSVQNANPFSDPATSSTYQQLTITLKVSSDTTTASTTQSSMTFTALNSDASSTASVCQQVSVDATT